MPPLPASGPWDHLPPLPDGSDSVRHALSSPVEPFRAFTHHQQHVAQKLAITAASISIVASMITSYWLLKMKRNFRHHLILLLIQSNGYKAIWLLVDPMVAITNGALRSGSVFCNVSGFLYAVGVEASDLAVLMIAIHTALYILRRKKATANAGLYPYRKYAYAFWVIFPLVTSGLAFIDPERAYISQVTHCYLRIRPYWYRIALSWAPRYIIFIFIIVVYGSIYAYVRLQFRSFNNEFTQTQKNHHAWFGDGKHRQDDAYELPHGKPLRGPPSTSKLNSHGLLSSSEDYSTDSQPSRNPSDDSNRSQSMTVNGGNAIRSPEPAIARAQPSWEALTFNTYPASLLSAEENSQPSSTPTDSTDASGSPTSDSAGTPPDPPHHHHHALQSPHPNRASVGTLNRASNAPGPLTWTSFLSSGVDFNTAQLRKRRHATQHQVTLLFLYPLAYILMWIVPFVGHCFYYSDAYAARPSFALSCATTVTLALQAAVDCLVFVLRERPWQHIPGSRRTLADSFRFWRHRSGHPRDPLTRAAAAAAAATSGEVRTGGRAPDDASERRLRLGSLAKAGPEVESAPPERAHYMRTDSDRSMKLLFVRTKLGKGRLAGAARRETGNDEEGEREV